MSCSMFIGDHPEIQSEAGNSQGGTYPCPCGTPVSEFNNINLCYSQPILSLEERRQKVSIHSIYTLKSMIIFCLKFRNFIAASFSVPF